MVLYHLIVLMHLLCAPFTARAADLFNVTHTQAENATLNINLDYELAPLDALFKNSIRFSVDTPTVEIVEWKNSTPAKTIYDTSHTTNMLGYTGTGTLTVTLRPAAEQLPDELTLFMHYQQKSVDHPQEFACTIVLREPTLPNATSGIELPTHVSTTASAHPLPSHTERAGLLQRVTAWASEHLINLKHGVSNLVETTQSTPLRLFFAFLLGILMSLTPCIYPMIPITVGILQTTAGTSFARNFLLALSYTLGIAVTFALLGLLAALGSAQFGAIMGNPYFVIFLVAFLAYLAFSMLGFYDMYVPRFMQGGSERSVNGSYLSAFVFGAISGSAASPCVSPGLGLMFSIVATIGNAFLGFLYLFFFGLGLGTPLLIIGTFSNSMNLAPRAGVWMLEIKKLFGLMLLSMCFFYLNAIMPWYLLLVLIGATLSALGVWYVVTIERYYSAGMRWYKQIFGTLLIVAGCIAWYQAVKAALTSDAEPTYELRCNTNYNEARAQAIAENKLLLIDFGARWCSSCTEIEHKFLCNTTVIGALSDVVIVKIDCTNPHAESCAAVQELFSIVGFPTMLVVAPQNERVLARWGGELLDLTPEQFITLVQSAT